MANLNKKIFFIFLGLLLLISLTALSSAKTTCKRDGGDEPKCDITITINIAYWGANQSQMNDWNNDIEDTWNGDEGHQEYGECKCNVYYEVNSTTTTNCTQAMNQGYHCIMVTPGLARDSSNKTYRGYMYSVSQNGSSTQGWWSSQINQPLPGQAGDIHDAAHEAGHMMGLGDDYNANAGRYGNNIMGRTWGQNATPNQSQIDATVENNCKGEDAECPDECCCGDGKIDDDKGEECDPMADPTGCEENEQCTENCTCIEIPAICGDGLVTGAEECDPEADPTGCGENEQCTDECECEEKPSQLSIRITDPDDGDEIDEETDVDLDIDADEDIDKVKFYFDNDLEETVSESPWEWAIQPWLWPNDVYELEVLVIDEKDNEAEDSIDIELWWYWDAGEEKGHCGNEVVDEGKGEICDLTMGCEVNFTCNEYCTKCIEVE